MRVELTPKEWRSLILPLYYRRMVLPKGFEPLPRTCKIRRLPLSYRSICWRRGLNPRPPLCQSGATSTELLQLMYQWRELNSCLTIINRLLYRWATLAWNSPFSEFYISFVFDSSKILEFFSNPFCYILCEENIKGKEKRIGIESFYILYYLW